MRTFSCTGVALLGAVSMMIPPPATAGIIIRVTPDAVSPLSDSPFSEAPTVPMGVADTPFLIDEARADLAARGAVSIRPIATYWRNVDQRAYFDRHGNRVRDLFDFREFFAVDLHPAANAVDVASDLRESRWIEDAGVTEPGMRHSTCSPTSATFDDPLFSDQWGLHNDGTFANSVEDVDINLPEAVALQGECEVKIGILDTGIYEHEDLTQVLDINLSQNFYGTGGSTNDLNGHGTAAAGVAAAAAQNGVGVASPGGVGWETSAPVLVALRVGSSNPDDAAVVDGIAYAVANDIPVLSMSFGWCVSAHHEYDSVPITTIKGAVRNAFLQGHLLVGSLGNAGVAGCSALWWNYPAAFDRFVLGVGHIRPDGSRKSDYRTGYYADVVAPGGVTDEPLGLITSTCAANTSGNDYHDGSGSAGCLCIANFHCNRFGGTSASAPLVAGSSALLWSAEPDLTNEDIEAVLTLTARDYGPSGWDSAWGSGLIRLDEAIRFASCDNQLHSNVATGWDSFTNTGIRREQEFRNTPAISASKNWIDAWVHVWELRKTVSFPGYSGSQSLDGQAWARGRLCETWSDTTRYDKTFEAPWARLENVSAQGADIVGYVYQVWNADSTAFLGWHPFHPESLWVSEAREPRWEYAYLVPNGLSRLASGEVAELHLSAVAAVGLTEFRVTLPAHAKGTLQLFDPGGRLIKSFGPIDGSAENISFTWDHRDDRSRRVGPGVYFARLTMGSRSVQEKVTVIR